MRLFGILNVTPDSFSDGGQFLDEGKAVLHARELSEKCHAVDIGAQSTKPGAVSVSVEEEAARLGSIISKISEFTKVSIDSFYFETQKIAIDQGASYINDVCAFKTPAIFSYAPSAVKFVFMHHLVVPPVKSIVMQSQKMDMIREIKSWAVQKINEYSTFGIVKNRLIFDVGIGFGKTAEQSLYIIEHAEEFLSLGVEIMFGHSRKSFMEIIKLNATMDERDMITQEITAELARKGIHYARVHKI